MGDNRKNARVTVHTFNHICSLPLIHGTKGALLVNNHSPLPRIEIEVKEGHSLMPCVDMEYIGESSDVDGTLNNHSDHAGSHHESLQNVCPDDSLETPL